MAENPVTKAMAFRMYSSLSEVIKFIIATLNKLSIQWISVRNLLAKLLTATVGVTIFNRDGILTSFFFQTFTINLASFTVFFDETLKTFLFRKKISELGWFTTAIVLVPIWPSIIPMESSQFTCLRLGIRRILCS
eukprot:GHVO01033574.1.p2 GENE.GHVO01033574.1~~GHVO01033574.1.p2  ORF type:complete len:135 (-),score=10.24 GHVO01033574.1:93-497(-)